MRRHVQASRGASCSAPCPRQQSWRCHPYVELRREQGVAEGWLIMMSRAEVQQSRAEAGTAPHQLAACSCPGPARLPHGARGPPPPSQQDVGALHVCAARGAWCGHVFDGVPAEQSRRCCACQAQRSTAQRSTAQHRAQHSGRPKCTMRLECRKTRPRATSSATCHREGS